MLDYNEQCILLAESILYLRRDLHKSYGVLVMTPARSELNCLDWSDLCNVYWRLYRVRNALMVEMKGKGCLDPLGDKTHLSFESNLPASRS
jgi:hypothetical protein